jgi:hypothetical protein
MVSHSQMVPWRLFLAVFVALAGCCCGPFSGLAMADPIRVKITRDTWVSTHPSEARGNNGGSSRLKLKSIQEMALLDFDAAAFKGKVIQGATLHVRLADKERLWRVTASTVASRWVEGMSSDYKEEAGASSYLFAETPGVPWAFPGSRLNAVMLGMGNTLWGSADATDPDANQWQTIPIDPRVLRACVAGTSQGFLLFDDTGSEWTRDGDKFEHRLFPNRRFYAHEQSASAPYLMITATEKDAKGPAAVEFVSPGDAVRELPAGESVVAWKTPRDAGSAGTMGFDVTVNGTALPRYLIPPAGEPGAVVECRVRDVALPPGVEATITVVAIDGAGNRGPEAKSKAKVSDRKAPTVPGRFPKEDAKGPDAAKWPTIGATKVAVIDALDKVLPLTGKTIPEQPADYFAANHLWSASDKTIRLAGAKKELVAAQIVLDGPLAGAKFAMTFPKAKAITAEFSAVSLVTGEGAELPDPLIPLTKQTDLPLGRDAAKGAKSSAVVVELFIPESVPAGKHDGRLTIQGNSGSVTLAVELTVWSFALPDELGFLPELNCYDLPGNELGYYRLAHRHRTVVNRVPYYQRGTLADGCAPKWDGKTFDWKAWDERFAKYFDGSAFADLPRGKVPLELFYLPLHENWPTPMEGYYNGSYWAEKAFPESYRAAFVEASRQYAEHLAGKKWNQTMFHVFLNNKVDFKKNGWKRASSVWLLDEPANWQDYVALAWFGDAFQEGYRKAGKDVAMLYRCDISRPEWQREALDHLLDYNVVAGEPFLIHNRLILDRKYKLGQTVMVYGTTNHPAASNIQPVAWAIDTWSHGGDGILPWQTVGNADSWKKADQLALLYPGDEVGSQDPIPSIRLKAYTRAQQDAEYLRRVALELGCRPEELGPALRKEMSLTGKKKSTGWAGEDAGVMDYGPVSARSLWSLRMRLGAWLSESKVKSAPAPAWFKGPMQRTPSTAGRTL